METWRGLCGLHTTLQGPPTKLSQIPTLVLFWHRLLPIASAVHLPITTELDKPALLAVTVTLSNRTLPSSRVGTWRQGCDRCLLCSVASQAVAETGSLGIVKFRKFCDMNRVL